MNLIKSITGYLRRKRELGIKIRSLKKLTLDEDPIVKNIGTALIDAVNGRFSPEEKEAIEEIEKLRSNLLASKDNINILDFGAGKSFDQRGSNEMYEGTLVSKSVSKICLTASKSEFWSQILFKIIRYTKVKKCIELGTCFGISGLYQSAALAFNGAGELKTLEGSPEIANIARNNFNSVGTKNISLIEGRFQDNLDELLKESNYDYAFIDGHHDKDATIHYFEKIYPSFASKGIFVFDDINWSEGMAAAWEIIKADKKVKVSIDLGPIGICVIDKNSKEKRDYKF